ncbi:MAG: adenylosuccinate synthetase [Dehalococcoidia bacterium]|jgi:adenylosuccinate synthase
MKGIEIIIDLGFGDGGKGAHVNYRCTQSKNPLVIRFNGGHQVGHTVVYKGMRHVFSNFGSGTLVGAPTYWSEYCTVNPRAVLKEGNALREMGVEPVLYLNANAMVTTIFDIIKNHVLENGNNHGSVGVGFGATIQRNDDHYHLYVRDLFYPRIRDEKLNLLSKYYGNYVRPYNRNTAKAIEEFKEACDDLVKRYKIIDNLSQMLDMDWIFEGGQGIMLDMDYGFFPHVTRSNTTSKNALEIIKKHGLDNRPLYTYYVTRAYQTRHGNGPMTNNGFDISYIKDNPNETNTDESFQGEFRKSVLDLDLLKYAFECDKYHNPISLRGIVITCLDQISDINAIPVTINGELTTIKIDEIGRYLGIPFKFPCFSEEGFQETVTKC